MTNTQHLKQELEDARHALSYATMINDRYGMANAMKRIRLAKRELADRAPIHPTLPEAA